MSACDRRSAIAAPIPGSRPRHRIDELVRRLARCGSADAGCPRCRRCRPRRRRPASDTAVPRRAPGRRRQPEPSDDDAAAGDRRDDAVADLANAVIRPVGDQHVAVAVEGDVGGIAHRRRARRPAVARIAPDAGADHGGDDAAVGDGTGCSSAARRAGCGCCPGRRCRRSRRDRPRRHRESRARHPSTPAVAAEGQIAVAGEGRDLAGSRSPCECGCSCMSAM